MDESLFKQLMLAGEGDENLKDLIERGYFKIVDGAICRTSKFLEETGIFIDAKKEALYQAVKETGSAENIEEVMEKAGIKDFITFVFMAEELVEDGKVVKDKLKNVVLRQ